MSEQTFSEAPSFMLTTEPWLPCLAHDGEVKDFSLIELFRQAPNLKAISGELPVSDFALLRLCLAIIYAATKDQVLDPELWSEWFEDGLPVESIETYLAEQGGKFDLFDPETPFFQVAALHNSKNERFGLERLVLDVPSGKPFMTTRIGPGLDSLSFAEAARWLVTTQAFDTSGIKTGAVGDPRVKGGRGYGIGTGWSGNLGGLFYEGASLHETLMLNLVGQPGSGRRWLNDAPAWETFPWNIADKEKQAAENPDAAAKGPQALYTWQSRRVRLFPTDGLVTHVLVAQGDPLKPHFLQDIEPMTAWRKSDAQQKALKSSVPVYMPQQLDPARMLWRNVASLLPDGKKSSRAVGEARLPSEGSRWLSELKEEEALPDSHAVRLHGVGLVYGTHSAFVDDMYDDAVSGELSTFASSNPDLHNQLHAALEASEQAVLALRNLAGNLAIANGLDTDGPRTQAGTLAYAALDAPFREWFSTVTPENIGDRFRTWVDSMLELILSLGTEMTERAVSVSFFGREINDRRINPPQAEAWFRAALRKIRKATLPDKVLNERS